MITSPIDFGSYFLFSDMIIIGDNMKKLITIVIALLSCLNIVDSKYANNQIIDYIKNTYL